MASYYRLPASPVQSYVCDFVADPNKGLANHRLFNIPVAVRIRPKADLRRLERAFHKLQQRHDPLRTQFVHSKGNWQVLIHDTPRAQLAVHDYPAMSEAEQYQQILPFLEQPADICRDPMARCDVLRFGEDCDVVLLQVSHTVCDGFGATVAFDDLVSLLWNRPFLSKATSFSEFSSLIKAEAETDAAQRKAYWENLLLPVAPLPKFGRHAKGLPILTPPSEPRKADVQVAQIDSDKCNAIMQAATDNGHTVFSRLAAAFQQTLHEISGTDDTYFFCLVGRHQAELDRYIGMHLTHLYGRFRAQPGVAMSRQIQTMHNQVQSSIAHLPSLPAGPHGEIIQKINAQGRSTRQFRLHMAQSEVREAKLKHSPGGTVVFGPYRIEGIPLPGAAATLGELDVLEKRNRDGLELMFVRDVDALTRSELDDFSMLFVENFTRMD